ncbi:Gfo/Idh/MocA family oxidoreductase [Magnetovibrio sp. PR-2]|uniref:Gfo/Idh/MocA family protein n=1 Tax=Magnetovibrio sp. PR-2 TaxID=3120356 RepID=UPI002FCE3087
MTSPVFCVLGLGSIGLRHAKNLINLGHDVIGFDPSAERGALLVEVSGRYESDKNAALGAADAALICTPSEYHFEDLCNAIDLGLHAFVEKPLAHSNTGLNELFKKADAKGRVIFHGLFLRHHPCVQKAQALIEDGSLGKILWGQAICSGYLPNWRPHQDYSKGYAANPLSGGALFDNIHEFDLMYALLGPAFVKKAETHQSGILNLPTEDIADVILRHDQGAQTTVHVDYVTQPSLRTTILSGTKGRLEMDLIKRKLTSLSVDHEGAYEETFPGTFDDDYVSEMEAFVDCIEGRAQPLCSNSDAAHVLDLILSSRTQSGLPIDG